MVIRVRKTRRPDSRVESPRVAFNNNGDEHARFSTGRFIDRFAASTFPRVIVRYFGGDRRNVLTERNPRIESCYNLPRGTLRRAEPPHNFTRLERWN